VEVKDTEEVAEVAPPQEEEESSDFELINHPSYQEQGVDAVNRRRRRRSIDPPSKVESGTKSKGSNGTKGTSADSDNGYKSSKDNKESKEVKTKGGTTGRPTQREEPKKKITVEMTPLEQDMYALMGLSPLVRLDEKADNRKALVYAVEPGEKTETDENQLVAVEEKTNENQAPEETTEAAEASSTETVVEAEPIPESSEASESSVQMEQQEESPPQESEPEPSTPEEKGVVRRRRRRSSARK
jgi:ribonuclease E